MLYLKERCFEILLHVANAAYGSRMVQLIVPATEKLRNAAVCLAETEQTGVVVTLWTCMWEKPRSSP